MQFTMTEGVLIAIVGAFCSLVVFAVKAMISESRLKSQLEMRDLELKVVNDYIKPAFDQLLTLVSHVDEQLKIRDEMHAGFAAIGAALTKRDQQLTVK